MIVCGGKSLVFSSYFGLRTEETKALRASLTCPTTSVPYLSTRSAVPLECFCFPLSSATAGISLTYVHLSEHRPSRKTAGGISVQGVRRVVIRYTILRKSFKC
ncbi:unnamed protein product, partial [Scytosiphon promiscuus]